MKGAKLHFRAVRIQCFGSLNHIKTNSQGVSASAVSVLTILFFNLCTTESLEYHFNILDYMSL